MIRTSRANVFVMVLFALSSLVAEAHHGVSQFDEKEVTMKGVVKEFQYTNPHSWLNCGLHQQGRLGDHLGLPRRKGRSADAKRNHKSDFAPGTKLTLTVHPLKNGQPAGSWVKAVRDDGVEFSPRLRPGEPVPSPTGNGRRGANGSGSSAPAQ